MGLCVQVTGSTYGFMGSMYSVLRAPVYGALCTVDGGSTYGLWALRTAYGLYVRFIGSEYGLWILRTV